MEFTPQIYFTIHTQKKIKNHISEARRDKNINEQAISLIGAEIKEEKENNEKSINETIAEKQIENILSKQQKLKKKEKLIIPSYLIEHSEEALKKIGLENISVDYHYNSGTWNDRVVHKHLKKHGVEEQKKENTSNVEIIEKSNEWIFFSLLPILPILSFLGLLFYNQLKIRK